MENLENWLVGAYVSYFEKTLRGRSLVLRGFLAVGLGSGEISVK
jgi:hypothetical protein